MHKGQCACGSVHFECDQTRPTVTYCHCSLCRRTSGHHWAATVVPMAQFRITKDDGLKWWTSSEIAKRGFCQNCGSSLFFYENDSDDMGVAAGCIDPPTGLSGGRHIFTASRGDYYDLHDGLPQVEE